MPWVFRPDRPIFQQLVEIIIADIASGRYQKGEKLPTVRDLAIEAGVNPNTVQRAYAQVEAQGFIFTKRGDGRYVSQDEEPIKAYASESLHRQVRQFVKALREMGHTDEEIKAAVAAQLEKEVIGG